MSTLVRGTAGRRARRPLVLLLLFLGAGWHSALAQERAGSTNPSQDGGAYRRPLGNDPATLDPAGIRDTYGLADFSVETGGKLVEDVVAEIERWVSESNSNRKIQKLEARQ